jgi:hypothetical protein
MGLRVDPGARVAVRVPDATGVAGRFQRADPAAEFTQTIDLVETGDSGTDDHDIVVGGSGGGGGVLHGVSAWAALGSAIAAAPGGHGAVVARKCPLHAH